MSIRPRGRKHEVHVLECERAGEASKEEVGKRAHCRGRIGWYWTARNNQARFYK
jgi:hypothetical protein